MKTTVGCAGANVRAPVYAYTSEPLTDKRIALGGLAGSVQRATQVFDQVVRVLEPDRQADRAFGNPGLDELLRRHPEMRGARRMDDQRFRVTDIGEMREDLQRLDERTALRARAPQVEAENRTAASRQKLLRKRMVRMAGKVGIGDALNQRMPGKESDDLARVLDMARHAQRERLDPLQDLECGERRHACAEIADAFASRAQQESRGARFLAEHHVVEAAVGLGQRRKFGTRRRRVPVELPRIDEEAA